MRVLLEGTSMRRMALSNYLSFGNDASDLITGEPVAFHRTESS